MHPYPVKFGCHKPQLEANIKDNFMLQKLESEGAYKVSCGKCSNPLGHEFLKDGPDGVGSRSLFPHNLASSKTNDSSSFKML